MRTELIIWTLLVFGLTNCSTKEGKSDDSTFTTTFKSEYDTLKTIELPTLFNWDSWGKQIEEHNNKYGIGQGWDIFRHPFAKLVDDKDFKAIIFISPDETGSPTLITIDKKQNPIDTLFILGDISSNDPSIKTIEYGTINSDLTIQLLDSVFTYDVKDDSRIKESEKLTVEIKKYRVEKDGQIKKME